MKIEARGSEGGEVCGVLGSGNGSLDHPVYMSSNHSRMLGIPPW